MAIETFYFGNEKEGKYILELLPQKLCITKKHFCEEDPSFEVLSMLYVFDKEGKLIECEKKKPTETKGFGKFREVFSLEKYLATIEQHFIVVEASYEPPEDVFYKEFIAGYGVAKFCCQRLQNKQNCSPLEKRLLDCLQKIAHFDVQKFNEFQIVGVSNETAID